MYEGCVRTLLVVMLALASCAPSHPMTGADVTAPTSSVRPTEALDAATRTACATRVLGELVDAINKHDAAALERLAGPSATHGFEWVSMTSSAEFGPTLTSPAASHEVNYTPEGARLMLLTHSEGLERWTLTSVRAGAGPSWHGGVDAEVHLERRLASSRPRR